MFSDKSRKFIFKKFIFAADNDNKRKISIVFSSIFLFKFQIDMSQILFTNLWLGAALECSDKICRSYSSILIQMPWRFSWRFKVALSDKKNVFEYGPK